MKATAKPKKSAQKSGQPKAKQANAVKPKAKQTNTVKPKAKVTNTIKPKAEQTEVTQAKGLRDLFIDELKDIYWAEIALINAIPKMIKNASVDELMQALNVHLEITMIHAKRLEEVFAFIGENAEAVKCEAMTGLIKEAEQIMQETEQGLIRDVGIISAAQKIEHYEIATYGTLCSFARTLQEYEVASLLQETLDEEREADELLSELSEAMQMAMMDEEEDEDAETLVLLKSNNN